MIQLSPTRLFGAIAIAGLAIILPGATVPTASAKPSISVRCVVGGTTTVTWTNGLNPDSVAFDYGLIRGGGVAVTNSKATSASIVTPSGVADGAVATVTLYKLQRINLVPIAQDQGTCSTAPSPV